MSLLAHNAHGIDVSDNNGDFDWHNWNGHIDFAMVKASEGPTKNYPTGYRDNQFERNWQAMKAIDVFRFAYHYAIPDHDPAAQAHYFMKTVFNAGMELHDNFVLDLEEANGMPPIEVAFWAYCFCATVNLRLPQHKILVYTYPWFAESGHCAMLERWPLWIANYDVPRPAVPPPWDHGQKAGEDQWRFWQYKGTGVDLDVFNGGKLALEEFCTH